MSGSTWHEHVCALLGADDRLNKRREAMPASVGLLMLCSVWALSFLSPVNGNLNIDFCFLFKEHKLHFKKKKINLPNSNYKEHILGTCIIQSISVHNEQALVGRGGGGRGLF